MRRSCSHQLIDRSSGAYFLDVVNQAIVQPLDAHLCDAAEGEAVHSLVGLDVPEDRFDDLHSVGIGIASCGGIDELFHPLGIGFGLCLVQHKEIAT